MSATTPVTKELLEKKRAENAKLRSQLEEIRSERRRCYRDLSTLRTDTETLRHDLDVTTAHQESALRDRISHEKQTRRLQRQLDELHQCNVEAHDAFRISVNETVATINGVRLCPTIQGTSNWKEVNAALGQVALLLSHLEERYVGAAVTLRYRILPAGSQSKIRLRNPPSSSIYNLHFSEESFHFFGRRNFNTGLGYLLGYVGDLTTVLQQQDRTIVVPYPIDDEQNQVGGLSVVYISGGVGANEEDWTRAMKYLLTNIKHLLVYWAIGVSPMRTADVDGCTP